MIRKIGKEHLPFRFIDHFTEMNSLWKSLSKEMHKDPLNEVQNLVLGLHSVLQTSIMRRIDRSCIQHMGWYIVNHLYIKSQDAAVA